jgi:hypothetical protein
MVIIINTKTGYTSVVQTSKDDTLKNAAYRPGRGRPAKWVKLLQELLPDIAAPSTKSVAKAAKAPYTGKKRGRKPKAISIAAQVSEPVAVSPETVGETPVETVTADKSTWSEG